MATLFFNNDNGGVLANKQGRQSKSEGDKAQGIPSKFEVAHFEVLLGGNFGLLYCVQSASSLQ